MPRIGASKPAVILGIALVVLAIGLTGAGPLSPREEPAKAAPLAVLDEPSACVAGEALASTGGPTAMGEELARPRGCQPCKDRPWCECTYQGQPRISCDPCCYQGYPYPICLD